MSTWTDNALATLDDLDQSLMGRTDRTAQRWRADIDETRRIVEAMAALRLDPDDVEAMVDQLDDADDRREARLKLDELIARMRPVDELDEPDEP